MAIILLVLFYSNLVNIANYSFLSYSFSGVYSTNTIFEIIRFSRFPVIIVGVIIVATLLIRNQNVESFIASNIDVILFSLVLYFGLFNAIDLLNGSLYTIWQTFALISILIFYYYLKNIYEREQRYRLFFQFLFLSNFIILPLLLINLRTFGDEWTYHMAYSDKTFYPYCALSIMISIYMSRLLTSKSIFNFSAKINALLELLIVFLLFFFVFFSARRTPLFIMTIISFSYIFYIVGRRMWKKLLLVIFLLSISIYSIPKMLNYMEVHKYELSVLKKLDDMLQAGGTLQKDASYNERLLLWDMYYSIFQEHPIVGVGAYNSSIYQAQVEKRSKLSGYSPHNLYLGTLVEHGVIGLFFLLIMIIRSGIIALKNMGIKRTIIWAFYFLMPILVVNWAEFNLIPGQVFYWSTFLAILFPRLS